MNAWEKIEKLDDKTFKLITGVTRVVFNQMLEVLTREYLILRSKGGRAGLIPELRLTLALEYWREYRSLRHMSNDHQLSKTKINNAILWVEDVLSESEEFKLRDLKERFKPNEIDAIEVVLVDVTEQPIERPKYNQKDSYSGKKNNTQQNTKS